jgi:hypothetical protein
VNAGGGGNGESRRDDDRRDAMMTGVSTSTPARFERTTSIPEYEPRSGASPGAPYNAESPFE